MESSYIICTTKEILPKPMAAYEYGGDEMLPIGSVIVLIDGEQPIMITGRKPIVENIHKEEVYLDYIGCSYPTGVLDNQVYFFNEDNISKVLFYGYVGAEESNVTDFIKEWEKLTPLKKGKVNDAALVE
ncbi:DUF4176 domain-containing protein [Gracilibacillus saliphilus]|uniref:DUF4176 domain-containing protein n=1 Tax=Gracilibacillus saliphilus TaxID=543890 RepID=UPI001EE170DA|nr:DUF4176 domain-containing protein [Gracilibacillus saliphilus]